MRLAVVADIHGNLLALEAVLADLARHAPDLTVNLGDCASGPLWPRETMERLADLGAPTVRGNHDRVVGTGDPSEMHESDRFAYDALTEGQRAELAARPMQAEPAPGVLMFHARPDHDVNYLMEEVAGGRLVTARPATVSQRLGSVDARLALCGHSHRAGAVQLPDGPLIVNPGSVGCPAYDAGDHVSESGGPHARYALVDIPPEGAVSVVFRLVPYAFEDAARQAETNDRPEWVHALKTGFIGRD